MQWNQQQPHFQPRCHVRNNRITFFQGAVDKITATSLSAQVQLSEYQPHLHGKCHGISNINITFIPGVI